MNETLQKICDSLELTSSSILNSNHDDRTLTETVNWQLPALTRLDLSNMLTDLSLQIRELNIDKIDENFEKRIAVIPSRLSILTSHVLPHLFTGNGRHAMPSFIITLDWIRLELSPLFSWEVLHDKNALPKKLSTKLKTIQYELETLIPEKEEITKSVELIKNATETIENLPSDIEELKEAKKVITKHKTDSTLLFDKINSLYTDSQTLSKELSDNKKTSERIVENCEEAYRITTTKGLAGAFDQRAKELNKSMWTWVIGLLLALILGGYIGSLRFDAFSKTIQLPNQNIGIIIMEFIISILSVGAPIWFAWIATKQIGQRFKLSEDYGFKSSVAKAYEGYKKEASRLDERLEHRLFSSALTRLEEAPLRLMDGETHGSPWHEILESDNFKSAMNNIPEFRDKVFELAKEGISKVNSKNGKSASSIKKEEG